LYGKALGENLTIHSVAKEKGSTRGGEKRGQSTCRIIRQKVDCRMKRRRKGKYETRVTEGRWGWGGGVGKHILKPKSLLLRGKNDVRGGAGGKRVYP